jgi:hypothetical protein
MVYRKLRTMPVEQLHPMHKKPTPSNECAYEMSRCRCHEAHRYAVLFLVFSIADDSSTFPCHQHPPHVIRPLLGPPPVPSLRSLGPSGWNESIIRRFCPAPWPSWKRFWVAVRCKLRDEDRFVWRSRRGAGNARRAAALKSPNAFSVFVLEGYGCGEEN